MTRGSALSAISAAKRRFAIGDVCLHCQTVMVEGTTAYVRRHRGAEYVVCLARWRETKARLRAERGLPPLRPRGPKSPRPPKPEPGARAPEAVPYARVSAAAILSRDGSRWAAALISDDGKGNRTRRTGRRTYATSEQARAAADRMRDREERDDR